MDDGRSATRPVGPRCRPPPTSPRRSGRHRPGGRKGWEPPILVDSEDQAAAAALGVSGYPFFVLVDGDGEVVARWAGEIGTEPLDEAIVALDG